MIWSEYIFVISSPFFIFCMIGDKVILFTDYDYIVSNIARLVKFQEVWAACHKTFSWNQI